LVLVEVNELGARPAFRAAIADELQLAGYLGNIENGRAFGTLAGDHGVGTTGGSEDHTAILLSTADQLTCYRYFPVTRLRQVSLPDDYAFVVAASGIAADKTGTARGPYNRASAMVAELLERWRVETGRADETLSEAVDAMPDAVARLRGIAASAADGPALAARLEHFLVEDRQILPAAVEALVASRLDAFGSLVDRSQQAAEALLGNQVRETVTLARLARERGARAASSFGAGFGGSVWALVDAAGAEAFASEWLDAYRECHPAAAARATSFVTRPGPGAGSIGT
jgi:galactokinase